MLHLQQIRTINVLGLNIVANTDLAHTMVWEYFVNLM
jgi:hypothetical protein